MYDGGKERSERVPSLTAGCNNAALAERVRRSDVGVLVVVVESGVSGGTT